MYYKATFDDFKLGTIYEERIGDGYVTKVLTAESFEINPGSFNEFMEILYNLRRNEGNIDLHYRIKKLDEEDILSIGFSKKLNNNELNEGQALEFVLGFITLYFTPIESLVSVHIEKKNDFIQLFKGVVLNLNELTIVLLQIGILESATRNKKVKE